MERDRCELAICSTAEDAANRLGRLQSTGVGFFHRMDGLLRHPGRADSEELEQGNMTSGTASTATACASYASTDCSSRATVYCKFIDFYWHAQCNHSIGFFESKKRTHGSARQAADEVLSQVREENASATMRRLSPKQYEITLQNPMGLGTTHKTEE